jgi:hypothetical protein
MFAGVDEHVFIAANQGGDSGALTSLGDDPTIPTTHIDSANLLFLMSLQSILTLLTLNITLKCLLTLNERYTPSALSLPCSALLNIRSLLTLLTLFTVLTLLTLLTLPTLPTLLTLLTMLTLLTFLTLPTLLALLTLPFVPTFGLTSLGGPGACE